MSIIKINAITVPADAGDELAKRFAARAGAVDDQPGFEGFELLKPTDDRVTWLVVASLATIGVGLGVWFLSARPRSGRNANRSDVE